MKLLSLSKNLKEKKLKDYIVENKESFYKIAYSYVKNEYDALDIVHDAICKALSKINTLKDIDNIKPWFYKILINTTTDYIRKNKKYIVVSDDILKDSKIEYDKYSDIDLQRAVDSLDEIYKTVIILRYFEDMKIEDIAKTLDQNVSTIKTRIYKALSKLKIKIDIKREDD